MKVTSSFGTERVKSTRKQSPMEEAMVKLIDLENEINEDIDNLVDLKRKIAKEIALLEDENNKMVLELRYVALKKWEDVSDAMGCDLRWVYRVHKKAIKEFENTHKPLKATIELC